MENDLFLEMQDKTKLLDQTLSDFGRRGKDYADAERDYRIALAKKMLIERVQGTPTTIISDVCKGDPEVAGLKHQRDCKESFYKATQEGINVLKLEIKIIESQLDREYSRK